MSTIEYPQPLEIDAGEDVRAVIFTANDEYLVSGGKDVQVWRLKDAKRVATMQVRVGLRCVAVSKDGGFIAAGSNDGDVFVWDATNYEQVFAGKSSSSTVSNIDFSPDSSRLVSAANTAAIWDIAAHRKVQTLDHGGLVYAAKYSPQGDRIATATRESIRFWDSDNGCLLVDIKVELKPSIGLLWFHNHLFVKTYNKIKQINAAPGSTTVSEWSVRDDPYSSSCIALPQHGKFIAHSSMNTVAFWDTATHAEFKFSPVQHTRDINSIACSSDGQLLAIAEERKVIVKVLSSIVFPSVSEPDLGIDSAALDAWKVGRLTDAEALLSAAIPTSKGAVHHMLASRALVRARLGQWDAAIFDAEESIKIERSVIGYIGICVARIGNGGTDEGCQVCDIALLRCPSEHVSLFLLIKAVVLFMAGEHINAMSRMNDLVTDVWVDPALRVVQAYMHLLLGNKYMERHDYDRAIQSFEDARMKLGKCTHRPPLIVSLISGWCFDGLAITIQQRLCEVILAAGRAKEAGECMLRMGDQGNNLAESIKPWVSDFTYRCYTKLEDLGDSAMESKHYHEAISHYTAALSLQPAGSQCLLMKRSNAWAGKGAWQDALNDAKGWARSTLMSGSWKDALAGAVGFMLERFTMYRAVCEHLEETDRVTDAVACFHQMSRELSQEIGEERADWTREFKSRCSSKLEDYGDSAANVKQYDEAVSQYTAALALDPARPQDLLVKRSKTYAENGKWDDALNDANKVIEVDSSSPLGYERKYAALLGMERLDDAISAFETMLLKLSESSDPDIRERARHYVRPEQTREAIRTSIQNAIRDSPLVLINALSGRLCNKSEQAAEFESTPAFTTLIASMTTHIDHALIDQVVGKFYRYSTFSHTWEGNEPLYEKVIKIVVYKLEACHTHDKLQMFCKIVRDQGFNWAWSDTCCIDKGDHFVLQEALVSMFKWYEGSAMTIIFLCDVDRFAELGALTKSRWNSRGWTLQEYQASKVVQIYTKDWTPYLGLTIYNHKESPEIISEMEKATGISAQALMALRPGLNDVREKLHLASTRQTTRVEDAAYSLLGIFSMSLPVTYGEGDKALGRLLSQLLMSSGDTSILAWTGTPSSFNSCLPTNIAVFSQPSTSHIPRAIADAEMRTIIAGMRASSNVLNLATRLYDQVDGLATTLFAGQRMKLPCLAFKISSISPFHNGSEPAFRAQAGVLGAVEIKATQNLARLDSLYLVHPWIDFLLNRHASANIDDVSSVLCDSPSSPGPSNFISPVLRHTRSASLKGRIGRIFGGQSTSDTASLSAPSTASPMKARIRFLQFIARLKQPFGALLLAPTRQNVAEYRRIATESLITARVQEITSATLEEMIQGVRVLDVL